WQRIIETRQAPGRAGGRRAATAGGGRRGGGRRPRRGDRPRAERRGRVRGVGRGRRGALPAGPVGRAPGGEGSSTMGKLEVIPGAGGARSRILQQQADRLLGLLNLRSSMEREIAAAAGELLAQLLAGAEVEAGAHEIEA